MALVKPVTMPDATSLGLLPPRSAWRWHSIALAVLALDLLSKALVSQWLTYGQPLTLLPVFDLILLHNPGAAFSFLADAGGWQRYFFVLISVIASVVIYVWINRLPHRDWITALGLALILGGALGNLHDRVVHGYVVDFLAFHWNHRYFPAFNIADAGISVGAALILWVAVFGQQDTKSP